MRELIRRTAGTVAEGDWERRVCRGALLSKTQYRHVLEHLSYEDGCALRRADVGCVPEDAMDGGGVR